MRSMATLMAKPTIGSLIKDARDKAGISQRELARLSGVSQPNLSRIEADSQEPSISTLREIAKALGVDYRDLLP